MILRFLVLAVLAGAIFAGVMTALQDGHASTWEALWTRLIRGGENPHQVGQFKVDLLDYANNTRLAEKKDLLLLDQELENWLQDEIDSGLDLNDLEAVVGRVQKAWPRYMRVSVTTSTNPALDRVRENFQTHLDNLDPSMTHLACALRSSAGGIATQVLLLSGQRLRDFSPDLLHRTGDEAFFHVCPHCRASHISRVQRHQESSTLECPSCHRAYAVIAADTQGRFHYVNEYLTGYQPPAIYPAGQSRVEQLFTIWSAVHQNCRYVRDPASNKEKTDRWQTAVETQALGTGDCEDSAIYLADWLTARGYDARVALGKYGDIGGHAWVVVRLDGLEYLLESTSEGNPDLDHPPLVSRMGSRYIPEVQFDRWSLYVRAARHQPWQGDYWSERDWIRLEPRAAAGGDPPVAKKDTPLPRGAATRSLQKDLLHASKLAYIHRTDRQAAPFLRLEQATDHGPTWGLPVALPGEPGAPEVED